MPVRFCYSLDMLLRLVEEAPPEPLNRSSPLLAKGFRPFFLLGAWYGGLAVLLWLAQVLGLFSWRAGLSPMAWHGHEMIFGFTTAIIAGFLLTAVPNWTGRPTPVGAPLGALVALWVLGRLAALTSLTPALVAAALDLAFLPALALALVAPLWKARKLSNLVFLPLLAGFSAGNGLVWAEQLGWASGSALVGLNLGLYCILTMIAVIGGRIIPFFIRAALPGSLTRSWPWVERTAVWSLPLVAVLPEAAGLAWLAAVANLVRLVGWHDRRLWRVPLLWVLYVGYAWLPLGLALRAAGASPFPALHALTAGCIGMMVLGMLARVALGHTGRPLAPPRAVVAGFVMVAIAAVLRTFGPLLFPSLTWVVASGLLWSLAFGLYGAVYYPILTRPRADGKPG